MRGVILDDAVVAVLAISIGVVALFKRQNCRQAIVTIGGIADKAGAITTCKDHVIVDDIAKVTREGNESRLVETNAKTTELDIAVTQ
ncbi:Brucella outer membrane protein 2 [compost metagenome]